MRGEHDEDEDAPLLAEEALLHERPSMSLVNLPGISRKNSAVLYFKTDSSERQSASLKQLESESVPAFIAQVKSTQKRNIYVGGMSTHNYYWFLQAVDELVNRHKMTVTVIADSDLASQIPHAIAVLNGMKVPVLPCSAIARMF